ncbi:MAG: hypothetical protein AAFN44_17110 [Pseudomonadota bacterium]
MTMVICATICPQKSEAGTTTADFLEWERAAQESFLQTSIGMLTAIASQVNSDVASCIGDWYYSSDQEEVRHDEMLEVMSEYSEYHPSTVVLAYVENICGRMN